ASASPAETARFERPQIRLETPKKRKRPPLLGKGWLSPSKPRGVHADAPTSRFCLVVSVNPGWRLAVYKYRSLTRSGITTVVSRIWIRTIAVRQSLVKEKAERFAQSLEGMVFKMSTYCGAISNMPHMWKLWGVRF